MLSLDNPHDIGNPPSRLPEWAQWAMVALFVVGFVASALFAATEHWRRATFVLGASMMWLAVMRYACDSRIVGLLAVRSRRADAVFCVCCGLAMVLLAGTVDSLGS
ncbi:hypothetical protein CKJ80_07885 [Corynebacterium hadale]|uniref:DUF3017 domain-containing protein n=1 Tax=Corynebacterium hadale TaxID=2026255 RepID=A0AB36RK58_9CORY|nr:MULTISPECIES: DUF3017 domain-containing protein [Corynebacterium]PAT10045.1 hypothetical protein CKJ80_07885 [Corynebacterium hadale]TVX82488.1 DUF3017 domain-containing protein [Corynebacterium sp. NML180780]